uniref:Membrane progesterone receptor epsilon-like n=1 Tax=Pogona vitticeps TaxID=103695 RepID=A0ABM5GNC4_9SAUR
MGEGGPPGPGPGRRRRGRGPGRLLRAAEVPASMTERFILSGYRGPGESAAQCLASAFRATNETGNFWTHFGALLLFAVHCRQPPPGPEGPPPPPAFFYPLWSYCLGVGGLLAGSSLAHLFSALSPEARELCFYIDYGTISAYTVGAALAYFYYIYPPRRAPGPGGNHSAGAGGPCALAGGAGPLGAWFEALYLPSACLSALLCTLACCASRRQWPRHRYLVRTLVFLLPFLVVSLPVFHKLWRAGGGQRTGACFLRHCLWLLASGLFNVSKIPERFLPGRFDIWGHSHQWFHCCSFLSILEELRMIRAEIQEAQPALPREPTFLSTFGVMLLLLALLAGIVAWFGLQAYRAGHRAGAAAAKGD